MIYKKKTSKGTNKKAISELVSYVLLIVLAIAMAAAAYAFLKPYAEKPLPEEECPESVNIVLENYSCNSQTKTMAFTLKNRGLFNVLGIKLSVVNENDGLEYDFLWLLPDCTEVDKCKPCSDISGNCLGVEKTVSSTGSYGNIQVRELVIYPVIMGEKTYLVCTSSTIKIPIAGCT